MAAHVGTNANFRLRWRDEMKMGIEAGDTVNLIERRLIAFRKTFQFRFGQEAVAKLNSPKIVEDHGAPSRARSAGQGTNAMRGAKWRLNLLHTTGREARCK